MDRRRVKYIHGIPFLVKVKDPDEVEGREAVIDEDDVLNLRIALEFAKDVDDLLKMV